MIKIAFLQLLPSECVEENMEKGIHYCKEARKLGADIALFPEMWSCGSYPSRFEKVERAGNSDRR